MIEKSIDILKEIEQSLYEKSWKCESLRLIEQYKKQDGIDDTIKSLLDRFTWLLVRNRFVEARRLVKREIENIQGITEKKCKLINVNKGYCKECKNLNCNLNLNKVRS